eukprot:21285-Heterococcus_DN1.PRE.2
MPVMLGLVCCLLHRAPNAIFLLLFESDSIIQQSRPLEWGSALRKHWQYDAEQFTPTAAVGRIGNGVVLQPCSIDKSTHCPVTNWQPLFKPSNSSTMLSRQSPWTDSLGMYGAIATGAVLAVTAIIAVGGFMRRPDQTCHKPTLQQELDSTDDRSSHVITTGTGSAKQQQQPKRMEWGMPSSSTNTNDVHTSTKGKASVHSSKQPATAAAAAQKSSTTSGSKAVKKEGSSSSALSSAEKLRGGVSSHTATSGTKSRAKPVTISDTDSDDNTGVVDAEHMPHGRRQQTNRAQQQQQQQQPQRVYNTRQRDRQQDNH